MNGTRWTPVRNLPPLLRSCADKLRAAGFEVCELVECCDAHPDQPRACYLCL